MGSQKNLSVGMNYKPVSGSRVHCWKGHLHFPPLLPPGSRIKLLLNGVSGVTRNVVLLFCKISANALGPYYASLDLSLFSNQPCQTTTLSGPGSGIDFKKH